ncbi:MAG: hypothetical protein M3Z35_05885 [Nitrospirota bacterium]|nr:hypothetical protein [Nitrospirota bacterium]
MVSLSKETRALLSIQALSEPTRSAAVSVEEPSEEYVLASRKLGINKIPLRLVELAKVVQEETLGTYAYEDVARYLDKQIEKLANSRSNRWSSFHEWCWHPVKDYSTRHYRSGSHFDTSIYNKPIPEEILPTIARIVDRFPDAEFYVTDIDEFKDPFLGVTVPGSDTLFVIERWDEPAFR